MASITTFRPAISTRMYTRCLLLSYTMPALSTKRDTPRQRTVVAEDGVKFAIAANKDYVPVIAAGLFLGMKKGFLSFATEQLRMVLAVAVLALAVVNVVIQKQNYDWVSSTLAPSALAAETLKILPAVPAAVVAFGTKLCSDLASLVNVSGTVYGLLATLAAAVYYNMSAVWFVGGWTILYGAKFVKAAKESNTVVVLPGAFAALLAAALVDYVRTESMTVLTEVTVCIIAAQVAWSIFESGRSFANEAYA